MSSPEADVWEAVHSVYEFHDRPVSGVADYKGAAFAYMREWDEAQDDWADTLLLSPLIDGQLSAIKEQWRLWLKWRLAHDRGALRPEDRHPALAEHRSRYDALNSIVEAAMKIDETIAIRTKADFRGDILRMGRTEVRWTKVR